MMNQRRTVVSMMLAVLFVFIASTCFGQAILGCYHHKNGKLRIVADHSLCKKTELPITWNVAGTQGEKGDKGDKGDTGNIGPQGPEGPSGWLSVYSANDEYLGPLVDGGLGGANIFLASLGKIFKLGVNHTEGINSYTNPQLVFTTNDCSGTPYLYYSQYGMEIEIYTIHWNTPDTKHYVIDNVLGPATVLSRTEGFNYSNCVQVTNVGWHLAHLLEVTLPFAYPVAVPLRLE